MSVQTDSIFMVSEKCLSLIHSDLILDFQESLNMNKARYKNRYGGKV